MGCPCFAEPGDNGNESMFHGGSENRTEQCPCQSNRVLNGPCNEGLEYPFNRINATQLTALPGCYSQAINNSCQAKFYEELPNMKKGKIYKATLARAFPCPMADHGWIVPSATCGPWCKCGLIPESALFPDSFEPYLPNVGKGRVERRQVRRKLHHPKCALADKEETEILCVPTNICYYRGTGRNVSIEGRLRFPNYPEPKLDKPGVKVRMSNQSTAQSVANETSGEFCSSCTNTKHPTCSSLICQHTNGAPSQEQKRGEECSKRRDECWINKEEHDKCPCQTYGKSNVQYNYIDDNEVSYPNEDDTSLCQFCLESSKYKDREPSNQNTYQIPSCKTCDMSNGLENCCSMRYGEEPPRVPGTLMGGCQAKPQCNSSMRSCLSELPRNLLYQSNRAQARTLVYEE
eukprot:gi/632981280/ref/XP_007907503.1/ PREDICTED: uncharacterized protein LOC103189061 [Callorhinchus milii]